MTASTSSPTLTADCRWRTATVGQRGFPCGAAAYNLRLTLAAAGTPAEFRLGRAGVLVHLMPAPPRPPTPVEHRLHRQIRRRHTTRQPFADSPSKPASWPS
ncbi:hypothetical protein ACQP00_20990 [Dactylosporangium sp. CS-047395]|uniref:hypothetical protein n=1 Tax=Dactylosporangium sp. CS-047395 TaxID=3239936 RepID=UPI003D946ACF